MDICAIIKHFNLAKVFKCVGGKYRGGYEMIVMNSAVAIEDVINIEPSHISPKT